MGSKSLELVDDGDGDRLRFGLVERGLGVRREIRVSEIEFQWLCLILKDAIDFHKEFNRSYGGLTRGLKVQRSVFEGGFML